MNAYYAMHCRFLFSLLLISAYVRPVFAQNKTLDAIVPGLSAQIQKDWTGMTNIVCDETMTWSGGIAKSEITAFRKIAIGYSIVESRHVKSVNGQSIPATNKAAEFMMSAGPLTAFGSVLPDNFAFNDSGVQFVEGMPARAIDFELRPDVRAKIKMSISGTLWVDTRFLHVVRFFKRSETASRTGSESAEYATIEIDGTTFVIPKNTKNEVSGTLGNVFTDDTSYTAVYNNCRKSPRSPEQQIILPQERLPPN